MEVHHHPHVEKKKFKEYLFEFFMLFLAVFCGFLAENFREHQVEHTREKQYMQSMIADLKGDTAMLSSNIQIRQNRIRMMDSLVSLLSSSWINRGDDLYFWGRTISQPANIFSNDGTIQQLKSSGNMRLVRNKKIADEILNYDQQIRQYSFEMGDEVEMRAAYRNMASKIFNTKIFYQMEQTADLSRPTGNPALFNNDPAQINELIGDILYLKKVHQLQSSRSEKLLNEATQLIASIKNDYDLK